VQLPTISKRVNKFYSSILLFIIGGFLIKSRITFGDGFTGMADGLIFLSLSILYTLVLLVILTITGVKYLKHRSKFNLLPLFTTILVVAGLFITFIVGHSEIQAKNYELTNNIKGSRRYTLSLKDNGKFLISKREIEWTCIFKGRYKIEGDSLTLLRNDIQTITDNNFTDVYSISKNKSELFPINKVNFSIDSSKSLRMMTDNK
jgi:hypothetical protein